MKKIYTSIQDLFIIKPEVFSDDRGYFMESFKDNWFKKEFPEIKFIQDNESKSTYGTLRGLHFQRPPYSQTKLVRVVKGKVLDVAIDLRTKSQTYGEFESVILSDENKKQFLVPKGFAHGFLVLSESAIFAYKVDNVYSKEHDSGIIWDSKDLNIDWKINADEVKVSKKDNNLETFNQFNSPF